MTDDPDLHSSSLLIPSIVNSLHGHVIGGCQRTAMLPHSDHTTILFTNMLLEYVKPMKLI